MSVRVTEMSFNAILVAKAVGVAHFDKCAKPCLDWRDSMRMHMKVEP